MEGLDNERFGLEYSILQAWGDWPVELGDGVFDVLGHPILDNTRIELLSE